MEQIWKPVPGFKTYMVSDKGNVKSLSHEQKFEYYVRR